MAYLPYQTFLVDFHLRFPIVQAPTGSIAGPELALAVCEAGGAGAMALTWASPETAAEHVRTVRAGSGAPFLVNFALASPPRALCAALEAGALILTFSWGDPGEYLPLVRSFGARVGIQVTTAAGARRAVGQGADFLICQGTEAGGHVQSTRSLDTALPDVLAAASGVPVVAAGGIGDGAAMARVLRMGASAVMLGTRFVATQESRAHPEYKRLLVAAKAKDTALTVCFDGGWPYAPHRVLRNSTLEEWEAAGCPPTGRRPGEGEELGTASDSSPILRYEDTAPRLGFAGDIAAMCCYAGTSVSMVDDLPSARDLVPRLWEECSAVLAAE